MNYQEKQDLVKLRGMMNGDNVQINWHDEGGGDVYKVNYCYVLFEVPQYGGESTLIGAFELDDLDKLIKEAHSWT